jgi:hypothetical protein
MPSEPPSLSPILLPPDHQYLPRWVMFGAQTIERVDGFVGNRAAYRGQESTFGSVEQGPYYAVELQDSTLGIKGGSRTTPDSGVIAATGEVIAASSPPTMSWPLRTPLRKGLCNKLHPCI